MDWPRQDFNQGSTTTREQPSVQTVLRVLPPVLKAPCDETLPVEVEKVESEDADLHLDLFLHSVLPLAGGQDLEGLDAFLLPDGDGVIGWRRDIAKTNL